MASASRTMCLRSAGFLTDNFSSIFLPRLLSISGAEISEAVFGKCQSGFHPPLRHQVSSKVCNLAEDITVLSPVIVDRETSYLRESLCSSIHSFH